MPPQSARRNLPVSGDSLAPNLALLAVAILMISLRLDGWSRMDLTVRGQLLLLPFTAFFFWILALLAGLFPLPQALQKLRLVESGTVALAICLTEQVFALALIAFEAHYFRKVAYTWHPLLFAALASVSVAAFAVVLRTARAHRPAALLLAAAVLVVGMYAFSIACFPLNPMRSDNLPLVTAAGQQLLHGHYPYLTYGFASGPVPLTYLPLTWLLYLPTVALHVDVRWTNPVLIVAAALLVFRSTPRRRRPAAAAVLSVFLLFPYMQFHHELYIAPQWLLLAAIYAALQRNAWWLAALCFGFGCGASQLFWVAVPFWLLYVLRERGFRTACAYAGIVGAGAAAWILPFLLVSPSTFLYCILGRWTIGPIPNTRLFNVSYWIIAALRAFGNSSTRALQAVQAVLLGGLLLLASRRLARTHAALFAWSALAITVFAASNFIVWAYFYVTALFALCLSVIERSEIPNA